jgi:(E)-4-hydroxy-3-methylbut-2-enyl-diphosphate synthase
MERRKTTQVKVGHVLIGGDAPVSVQSMLNRPAEDIKGSVEQAKALQNAGCDIIRAAVPTVKDVALIEALKSAVACPIVADIHFDYRIALACVEAGVDKIRINPGNIGDEQKVQAVAKACKGAGIPIRIGVNSGSVEKEILARHGGPTPAALAESGLYHASLLEKFDFHDIVISVKSSDVASTYAANMELSSRCHYPLHLGVTEAGTKAMGIMKSSAGIGGLLLAGVGDTIRFSLTDDPVQEVIAANNLLKNLGLKKQGATMVSCPTCGRTKIDLIGLADKVEAYLQRVEKPIKVAVMGCVVNGPGEAKEADLGIAGGDGCGVLFKKGEIIRKLPEEQLYDALIEEIEKIK